MSNTEQGNLPTTTDNTEQPQGALSSFTPSVPYKVVSGGKGQLNTISPTSGMLMDASQSASIKQNMQDLLKEYQSPWQAFKGNLRDMKADLQMNPAAAWAQRAAERQQQEANVYNLKMSMANMDATQNAARRGAQALGLPGYETTAPAQSGSASTPSGVPNTTTSSGIPLAPTLPPFQVMRNSLSDSDRAIFDYSLSQGDIPAIMKLAAQSSLKRPDIQKLYEFANKQPEDQKQMILGQIFEKGMGPRSYIENGKTIQYSPEVSLPPEMRQKPQTTGVSAPITNYGNMRPPGQSTGFQTFKTPEEDLAAIDKNLQSYGKQGVNTLEGIISKWSPPNENKTQELIDSASKRLGLNPKQTLDMANPAIRQAIGTAIILQEHGNKIFAAPTGSAPATVGAAPVTPGRVSMEDVKLEQENLGRLNTAFIKGTYDPLAERVAAQGREQVFVDSVLNAVETGDYGPGTSIGQMTSQAAQALGLPITPKERETYLRNLTVENAKQQFVASGAKAAMGAQYTAKESENFAKTLAGINDPKEQIKNVYQIKRAAALVDKAHKKFLESNGGDIVKANLEWEKTGIRDKIYEETVDMFKKKPISSISESKPTSTAKPAGAPADAKIGTGADGKPGWFVVRDGKTFQWKP